MGFRDQTKLPIAFLAMLGITGISIIILNFLIGHISKIDSNKEIMANAAKKKSLESVDDSLQNGTDDAFIPKPMPFQNRPQPNMDPKFAPDFNNNMKRMPPPNFNPRPQQGQNQERMPPPWAKPPSNQPPQDIQRNKPILEAPDYREQPHYYPPMPPYDFPEDEEDFFEPPADYYDGMPPYPYGDYEGKNTSKTRPDVRVSEYNEEDAEEEYYIYDDEEEEEEEY